MGFGSVIFFLVLIGLASSSDPILYDKVSINARIGGVKNADKALSVEQVVSYEGATWLRLVFGKNTNANLIRLTSILDGAVQHLNMETLAQWQYTSAYFNGDSVLVELFDQGGRAASNYVVEVEALYVGRPTLPKQLKNADLKDQAALPERSLCGPDSRVLSSHKKSGRFLGGGGCTGWLIDDQNHCFLTAQHCGTDDEGSGVMEFEVPLSLSLPGGGHAIVHPPPEHQYALDPKSLQAAKPPIGIGNDWQYFGCFPNTETGLTPFQRQGETYILHRNSSHPLLGATTDIIGYGVVEFDKPNEWNQVQKYSEGPLVDVYQSGTRYTITYTIDTTGGDSGSAIEQNGIAYGIHAYGGCSRVFGGTNSGMFIGHPDLQAALKNPLGVCAP